jgi:chitinase
VNDNVMNSVTVSTSQTTRVDRTAPTGTISAVPVGPVNGTTTITGTATDAASGVQSVDVTYSGPASGNICLNQPPAGANWSCPWDTTLLPDGTYTLTLVVRDNAGQLSGAITRTIVVDNQAPTITFNSFVEVGGAQYTHPSGTTPHKLRRSKSDSI